MKTILHIIIFILSINNFCIAQDYKYKYFLDANLVLTTEKDALFIGKGLKEDSSFKMDCFDKFNEWLIMSIHFKDSSLLEMNGSFISFYKNGLVENKGFYKNNLEEGTWTKKDTIGLLTDSSYYEDGVRRSYAKFNYFKDKKLSVFEFTDSLKNTYEYISFDTVGTKKSTANFVGNEGVYNKYDSGKTITTKVFTRELKEATCENFKNHLEKNMKSDVGIDNGIIPGLYQVIIGFIVNIDGSISDIQAETHFGFGLEAEAIRVIKNGPKWAAASFFGIPVKVYRRQPVIFMYSGY